MTPQEISAEFELQRRNYQSLEEEATFVLKKALRHNKIKTHSIPTRVKDLSSFLDKVKRKEIKEPFKEVHDIVGLRVICLFLSDIPRVGNAIRESFNVISEDDKIEGADVSSFGYLSFHFIVQMKKEYKGPRYDGIAGMPCEIQVRTILMDAWANVSHYLDYKSDIDVPKSLRRDFYALSGLFYIADNHFELFFKASKESSKHMTELASSNKPRLAREDLNLDSLTAYLRTRFPNRTGKDSKAVSVLLKELKQGGYTTIKQVDDGLLRAAEAFEAYEKDHPPTNAKMFSDVGVVRVSIAMLDENFEQIVTEGKAEPKAPSYAPKYKALIKKQ